MSTTVKVREKYQITIPEKVREKVSIKVGERVEVEVRNGYIVIRPMIEIPKDQAWFWSREWQEGIKKAKEEYRKGKARSFKSAKEARKLTENVG
ncbi:MAG: AbrB/MazE/SpoVT family DNA-binding domain-containing protein [Thermodesulfovibrionales bacterium]|nr:AbrB/MazE/SpoVT family DNA-binding domain-containing protein [Thermodesulfovibrionales bacterium]